MVHYGIKNNNHSNDNNTCPHTHTPISHPTTVKATVSISCFTGTASRMHQLPQEPGAPHGDMEEILS